MHLVAPFFVLAVVTECALASHSHFEVSRASHLSRQSTHSRLARRSSGRCGGQKKLKATHDVNNVAAGQPGNFTFAGLGGGSGLINILSSCGPIGATSEVTPTTGPNGNIDWLNCGVGDGGWDPPNVQVKDIIAKDLSIALQEPNSPFTACTAYLPIFEKYASQYGVPAILVASIAMQESTCNAGTVGGAGEQGLMQLTSDKCGGAPNGNCKDPDYNIRTGVEYFSTTLKNNGGNLLLTLGNYNGWPEGMTFGSATAAAQGPCCRCQNNLDYLHQTLNGWCQNVNPYTSNPRIGKYFNLDQCGS